MCGQTSELDSRAHSLLDVARPVAVIGPGMPSTAPTLAGKEVAVDAPRRRGDGCESIVAHGRARVAVREGSDAVVVGAVSRRRRNLRARRGQCKLEHVHGPAVVSLVGPDHDRAAANRDTTAELVIRSAVVRGQLGNLRPARGKVACRGACEHVSGPALGSLVVVKFRPDHHRVAVDRHARAEVVIRSAVVRVSLATCVQPEARSLAVARVNT